MAIDLLHPWRGRRGEGGTLRIEDGGSRIDLGRFAILNLRFSILDCPLLRVFLRLSRSPHLHLPLGRKRLFPADFPCVLILSQSEENRMPNDAVVGPGVERNFTHELRLDPVYRSVGFRLVLERTVVLNQWI